MRVTGFNITNRQYRWIKENFPANKSRYIRELIDRDMRERGEEGEEKSSPAEKTGAAGEDR